MAMNYPNIDEFYKDFEKESRLLGQGTFGVVYQLKTKRIINQEIEKHLIQEFQGQNYAVKMLEAQSLQSFQQIQKEFLILRDIPRHTNIINLVKTYAWQKTLPVPTYTLVLVMELAEKNLLQEIEKRREANNFFTDDELLSIFRQCFETFLFLIENQNIYHRDVKPENILLISKDSLHIKITDFGVSKKLMEEKYRSIQGTLVGTPVYLSPALWQEFETGNFQLHKIGKIQHNLEKSDVYSLGVTLLQCALLLKNEVIGLNQGKLGQQKTEIHLSRIKNQKIQQILRRMLEHDEKNRASYSEILKHFFVQPIQVQTIQQRAMTPTRHSTPQIEFHSAVVRQSSTSSKDRFGERKPIFDTSYLNLKNKLPPSNNQQSLQQSSQSFQSPKNYQSPTNLVKKDGNFCLKHEDQIVQYFCYSKNFANFCCDKCYQQFSVQQKEQSVTLPQFKYRIKSVQYNQELKEDILQTKKKLIIVQNEQEVKLIQALKNMQLEILIIVTQALEETSKEILDNFKCLQSYNIQFHESLSNILQENSDQIELIQTQCIDQLELNDLKLITNILDEQSKIKMNHERIHKRIKNIEDEQKNLILQSQLAFLNLFNVKSQSQIEKYITYHEANIFQSKLDWIDLYEFQNYIKSKYWELYEGRLILEQDETNKNSKVRFQMNHLRKMDRQIKIITLDSELNVAFQDEDLKLRIYNLKNQDVLHEIQIDEEITCFSQFRQQILLGTEKGNVYICSINGNLQITSISSSEYPISAIKGTKNGIICGTNKGTIHMLFEQGLDFEMEKLQSQHQRRIERFECFDQFKCLISVSKDPIINLHQGSNLQTLNTGLQELTNVVVCQSTILIAFDRTTLMVKFWTVQLQEDESITLIQIFQASMQDDFLQATSINNIVFTLNEKQLKVLSIDFDHDNQKDLVLDHFSQSSIEINSDNKTSMQVLGKRLIYSYGQYIYLWTLDYE